jgi:hypothetical protein
MSNISLITLINNRYNDIITTIKNNDVSKFNKINTDNTYVDLLVTCHNDFIKQAINSNSIDIIHAMLLGVDSRPDTQWTLDIGGSTLEHCILRDNFDIAQILINTYKQDYSLSTILAPVTKCAISLERYDIFKYIIDNIEFNKFEMSNLLYSTIKQKKYDFYQYIIDSGKEYCNDITLVWQ